MPIVYVQSAYDKEEHLVAIEEQDQFHQRKKFSLWIICIYVIFCCLLQEKKDYINCLKFEGHKSENCTHFSKKYLECRMEKEVHQFVMNLNLMAKQDMSELGFRKGVELQAPSDEDYSGRIS